MFFTSLVANPNMVVLKANLSGVLDDGASHQSVSMLVSSPRDKADVP